jgi:ABC-2 type transport system ATP-binding protein
VAVPRSSSRRKYLEEADELADTIAVVDHGKIIARGTSDQLKTQVGGQRIDVVVRRREDLPRASEILRAVDTTNPQVNVDEHTRKLSIATNGGANLLMQVMRDLAEANIDIDDIGLHRPTLDDVFLALTGHVAEEKPVDQKEAA